jgi:hypothetical protein
VHYKSFCLKFLRRLIVNINEIYNLFICPYNHGFNLSLQKAYLYPECFTGDLMGADYFNIFLKMKIKIILFLLPLLGLFVPEGAAQISVKDSTIRIAMLTGNFAQHIPGGDLAKRFGTSSNLGGSFMFKSKKNYLFELEANFLFGGDVKEDNIFQDIATPSGHLINQLGQLAEIRLYQRGLYSSFRIGKLFNFFGPNPNSGIFILAGAGFLQHKIRIENLGNNTPQVMGDYKKGYDRLTNGFAINQFVGYMYLSNNRLLNFYGGAEFIQAWTQNRRSINFDSMEKDDTKRQDLLSGIRIGWIIPLYKKMPQKYYYY